MTGPGAPTRQVAESPDGAFLAGQDRYGRLFVWDLATGELIGDPADRPDLARTIAFHPAVPTMLTIGLAEGGIAFYDVSTERRVGDPLRATARRSRPSPSPPMAVTCSASVTAGSSDAGVSAVPEGSSIATSSMA